MKKKKRNFLHKQIFKLKLKINNYFYRKKVRGISLNLCPSQYFGKMNSILFKNRPKVIYFNHPARDLKKNKPVYKKKKQKIVSLIGTTQTTFAQANIDFLIDELLTKYNDELDEFEFHIVGDCSNPSKKLLTATKKFRNIKICGYVDDLFDKIISSDVILHAVRFPPTSGYKLPNICSCHPCLLLHKAAFQGFPEIFKNKACLSALSGKEFVGKLKILTKNKSLSNKIRQNARKVYEKYYSLDNLPKILENCNNMIYKKNETYKDWN